MTTTHALLDAAAIDLASDSLPARETRDLLRVMVLARLAGTAPDALREAVEHVVAGERARRDAELRCVAEAARRVA